MAGRYYFKHTINHMVENNYKIKTANKNYKSLLKKNAIEYLKNPKLSIPEKLDYINKLTHDAYRYGTKYKYNCNLGMFDIHEIIRAVNDHELSKAYWGPSSKESSSSNISDIIITFIFAIFVLAIFFIGLKACGAV